MKYKKAYAQVVLFDNSDVVTASALGGDIDCKQSTADILDDCSTSGFGNKVEKCIGTNNQW